MYAKKSLGQNFLKSERALKTIIQSADLSQSDLVVEIGPGLGALTERLLTCTSKVIAIEKDDELHAKLGNMFEKEIENNKLELVHEDILDFDLNKVPTPYKLVANIPYNITGAIIKKFLSNNNQPERMVLLVQKEVAERIVAREEKETVLSLSVKAYGEPKFIEKVLAGSFVPAPKVDSAILLVENISKDFFRGVGEEDFFKLIKQGFSSKRKKLSSNLSGLYPKEKVLNTFNEIGLDENVRAEDLKISVWKEICLKLT